MVTLADLELAADEGRETLTPEEIEAGASARVVVFGAMDEYILDPALALSDLYEVSLTDEQVGRVLSGNPVLLRGRDAPAFCDEAYATSGGKLIAIGAVDEGSFKPHRVFGGKG